MQQIKVNDDSFDDLVASLKPSIVVFDRFTTVRVPHSVERVARYLMAPALQEEQFGWRVRKAWPSSICVLDTQDLHFIRRHRMRAVEEGMEGRPRVFAVIGAMLLTVIRHLTGETMENVKNIHIPLNSPDMLRELSSIYRSDLTLVAFLLPMLIHITSLTLFTAHHP